MCCVNYRALNDITVNDLYPLPWINDIFDVLVGAQWFLTLDMKSVYHQVKMAEKDKEEMAFSCGQGLWHFKACALLQPPSSTWLTGYWTVSNWRQKNLTWSRKNRCHFWIQLWKFVINQLKTLRQFARFFFTQCDWNWHKSGKQAEICEADRVSEHRWHCSCDRLKSVSPQTDHIHLNWYCKNSFEANFVYCREKIWICKFAESDSGNKEGVVNLHQR